MKKYIIDTNCFIESSRATNPLDVAISFWKKIKQLALEGRIYSIDKVKDEIMIGKDDLSNWMKKEIPTSFFLSTSTPEVLNQYCKLINWAKKSNKYSEAALAIFAKANIADAFLASFAATDPTEIIIVTNEKASSGSKKSVKLPDACNAVNVRCIRIMEMLREMKETF